MFDPTISIDLLIFNPIWGLVPGTWIAPGITSLLNVGMMG
jgi:hypothetical protein